MSRLNFAILFLWMVNGCICVCSATVSEMKHYHKTKI